YELDWLAGYRGAAPVRVGNSASRQFQLDVFGEVMDTLHLARTAGLELPEHVWQVQRALLRFLIEHWQLPDGGIWEIRGPPQQFTHSKVMVWVAFDRAVKSAETFGLEGPLKEWRAARDAVHAQVCRDGYDSRRNTFLQRYGSDDLDASLLLIPQVGFLSADDPRVRGTVLAIQSELQVDGLVLRYTTDSGVDGLPTGEGAFLPCTCWLADALALIGEREQAERLFEELLKLGNDVGLFSEEYDPLSRQMLGNFPQALTHMAIVNTARVLSLPTLTIQRSSEAGGRPSAAAETP
ncbi:MAG: glycoside hydrolase family 15 protein, partial [Planctomycetota bacterium]